LKPSISNIVEEMCVFAYTVKIFGRMHIQLRSYLTLVLPAGKELKGHANSTAVVTS